MSRHILVVIVLLLQGNSILAAGAAVPFNLSFVPSIDSVLLSKLIPLVPPERATVVSFANVHAAAFCSYGVTRSVSRVVFPSVIRLPSISNESSVCSWLALFL